MKRGQLWSSGSRQSLLLHGKVTCNVWDGGGQYTHLSSFGRTGGQKGGDSTREEWEVQLLQSSGLRGIEMNLGVLTESLGNS